MYIYICMYSHVCVYLIFLFRHRSSKYNKPVKRRGRLICKFMLVPKKMTIKKETVKRLLLSTKRKFLVSFKLLTGKSLALYKRGRVRV